MKDLTSEEGKHLGLVPREGVPTCSVSKGEGERKGEGGGAGAGAGAGDGDGSGDGEGDGDGDGEGEGDGEGDTEGEEGGGGSGRALVFPRIHKMAADEPTWKSSTVVGAGMALSTACGQAEVALSTD
jgi:hypothetical protein